MPVFEKANNPKGMFVGMCLSALLCKFLLNNWLDQRQS